MSDSLLDQLIEHLDQEAMDWRSVLENPEWEQSGRVHDWRNYVPEYIRESWPDLCLDARACCFLIACAAANNEVWD